MWITWKINIQKIYCENYQMDFNLLTNICRSTSANGTGFFFKAIHSNTITFDNCRLPAFCLFLLA